MDFALKISRKCAFCLDDEIAEEPVSKTRVGELKFGLLLPEEIDVYSDALNVYANLLYNGQQLQARGVLFMLYSNM